jgi:glycosyltransferase involved in cell wall biosynthesis
MRVAYFTPSSFRTVNAGALRNVGLARALVVAGHDVSIFSSDHDSDEMSEEWDAILDGSRIRVIPGGSHRRKRTQVLARLVRYLEGSTSGLVIKLGVVRPDALILYNADPIALLRLDRYASDRKLPFIVDVTEWLNPADLPGGRFSPLAILHETTMQALAWRGGRYLSISKTMAARLGKHGPAPLVVPPLFDIGFRTFGTRSTDRIRLVTTGTDLRPRGKDIVGLSLIAKALAEVDSGGEKFHLDVVGAYSRQSKAFLDERLSSSAFTLHGRLSWEATLAVVHNAAFSIVLRNPLDRRSNLGFPSKVPESLLVGTPILGNVFSDLAEHLEDGVNAVLVPQPTVEALVGALRSLPIEIDRESVRRNALNRYTPKAWSSTLSKFVAGNP